MDRFFERGFSFIQLGFFFMLFVVCGFLVSFGIYAIVASASSDGKIDYCRIHTYDTYTYSLEGHRRWRDDMALGKFPSYNDAKMAAYNRNCAIK